MTPVIIETQINSIIETFFTKNTFSQHLLGYFLTSSNACPESMYRTLKFAIKKSTHDKILKISQFIE